MRMYVKLLPLAERENGSPALGRGFHLGLHISPANGLAVQLALEPQLQAQSLIPTGREN